jgi:hypothetical protein
VIAKLVRIHRRFVEARWLTIVSPDDPNRTELLLEPDGHPAAKPFRQMLVDDGIPWAG